ncbi:MAG: manganese efflux pump [Mogibacterium sp.]|nr:manganese efflux pump [Mogibacterium sp.]
MTTLEVALLGVGLAMDAFAVSITEGLKMKHIQIKYMLLLALAFGVFQAGMPMLGWFLGNSIISYIDKYDHWIGFLLLAAIGTKSLIEALRSDDSEIGDDGLSSTGPDDAYSISMVKLLVLAVATSIDALAVGVTFALDYSLNVPRASALIGGITFAICCGGVLVGHFFGTRYRRKAGVAGGLILIAIGVRILLDGLGLFL